jgi:hypothetical protein
MGSIIDMLDSLHNRQQYTSNTVGANDDDDDVDSGGGNDK